MIWSGDRKQAATFVTSKGSYTQDVGCKKENLAKKPHGELFLERF